MTVKIGDRVMVRPGKEHDLMTKGKVGTVKQIETPALGIQFEDMKEDEIHKWYIEEEVEAVDDD